MADSLGMDPARIERLRSPERLEYFHPDRIWEVLNPAPDCTLIDIGAGPGYLTLPFAERFPRAKAYVGTASLSRRRHDVVVDGYRLGEPGCEFHCWPARADLYGLRVLRTLSGLRRMGQQGNTWKR